MRRRQNNPILTGEAGVGKTAVVEGFAQRIAAGDVPPPLRGVTLLRARHRPDAGRRLDEGRVRAAAALGHRRGAELADADHPVHRRGAYADRRRRRGRHGRCRQPAEAGAGARHAAHHRRDDLVGIPPVFREGPGADPPLPAGPGRRARRRARCRTCCAAFSRPMEKHHGVRISDAAIVAAVEPVAPLHPGAAAARQGGEPARHGLRARRHQPDRRRPPRSPTRASTIDALAQEKAALRRAIAISAPTTRDARRRDRRRRSRRAKDRARRVLESALGNARRRIVDEVRVAARDASAPTADERRAGRPRAQR